MPKPYNDQIATVQVTLSKVDGVEETSVTVNERAFLTAKTARLLKEKLNVTNIVRPNLEGDYSVVRFYKVFCRDGSTIKLVMFDYHPLGYNFVYGPLCSIDDRVIPAMINTGDIGVEELYRIVQKHSADLSIANINHKVGIMYPTITFHTSDVLHAMLADVLAVTGKAITKGTPCIAWDQTSIGGGVYWRPTVRGSVLSDLMASVFSGITPNVGGSKLYTDVLASIKDLELNHGLVQDNTFARLTVYTTAKLINNGKLHIDHYVSTVNTDKTPLCRRISIGNVFNSGPHGPARSVVGHLLKNDVNTMDYYYYIPKTRFMCFDVFPREDVVPLAAYVKALHLGISRDLVSKAMDKITHTEYLNG